MPNQRVAFASVLAAHPWGGSEELWSQTALRLLGRGADVAACVVPRACQPLDELRRAGCRVVPYRPFDNRLRARARRAARKAGLWPDWIDRFRPDLVVCSLPQHSMGMDVADACRRRGVRYVLLVQQATELAWPDDDDAERMAAAYAGAAACCFVAAANRRVVETQTAARLANARVVRNPFKVAYTAAPPWPTGDGLRLACVARLDGWFKGHDLLFEVLARPHWRSRPVTLTLFGTGPNARGFARLARAWDVPNVTFAGHVSDIERVWADHHALVLPSRAEGLPLAVVEAMLCGRPCVVTDVAGNTELLTDDESGFVAAAPTPACVDEALGRLWERRADLESVGRRAAEHVRRHVPPDPVGVFTDFVTEQTRAAAPA